MEVSINQFLTDTLFIGLGDYSNQKIKHNNNHQNGLEYPDDPYEKKSEKLFDRVDLFWLLFIESAYSIWAKQPLVIIWTAKIAYGISERVEQEAHVLI